jgi:SARP family transcriptional regulator, regulator of embCAB operon
VTTVKFRILGPIQLEVCGQTWAPPGPKVRQLLSLLLLRRNELVSLDTFAEELWDGRLPKAWQTTIRTHVYHLRKVLEGESVTHAVVARLITRPAGYLFEVAPGELDCEVFSNLVGRGKELLESGDTEAAAAVLRRAFTLWHGDPLSDVRTGPVSAQYMVHLTELRARALELRIDADLMRGQHRELIPELCGLVTADPLNEWLQAKLIEALRSAGRRSDALAAFRDARAVLVRELGIEPSAELQRLQREILIGGTGYSADNPLVG